MNFLKEDEVEESVDSVIKAVCKKIEESDFLPCEYAPTVQALAMLVEARAKL